MARIKHIATCTNNNRRIARFYRLVFDMEELWNEKQNSIHAFYLTDGYLNMNCLQINPGLNRKAGVGIEHFGIQVEDLDDTERKIRAFYPSVKIEESPRDGRYEDRRFLDPEGNRLELATNPWGAAELKKIPGIRHIGIQAKDPDRLADFYKSIFGMKEVERREISKTNTKAIFLSDGTVNLALVKNPPVEKPGIVRP